MPEIEIRYTLPFNRGRTKWDVLTARAAELRSAAEKAERRLRGLEATPCGLNCGGCGEYLATEKDFAAHFTIPDERYLNLGNCPKSKR